MPAYMRSSYVPVCVGVFFTHSQGHHLSSSLPRLPGKHVLERRRDAAFVEARRQALEQYLRALLVSSIQCRLA
jgi:PX domain